MCKLRIFVRCVYINQNYRLFLNLRFENYVPPLGVQQLRVYFVINTSLKKNCYPASIRSPRGAYYFCTPFMSPRRFMFYCLMCFLQKNKICIPFSAPSENSSSLFKITYNKPLTFTDNNLTDSLIQIVYIA